jgi:hypothetical protein
MNYKAICISLCEFGNINDRISRCEISPPLSRSSNTNGINTRPSPVIATTTTASHPRRAAERLAGMVVLATLIKGAKHSSRRARHQSLQTASGELPLLGWRSAGRLSKRLVFRHVQLCRVHEERVSMALWRRVARHEAVCDSCFEGRTIASTPRDRVMAHVMMVETVQGGAGLQWCEAGKHEHEGCSWRAWFGLAPCWSWVDSFPRA